MSDSINRQLAIDSIMAAGKIGKLTCCDILRNLPSAQPEDVIRITGRRKFVSEFDFDEDEPEQRWISCDERLPEKDGMYYVTVRDSKGDIDAVPCLWFFDKWGINGFEVIAWIKIPEPYRGDK